MPTEREKMTAGEAYDVTDEELVADRMACRRLTCQIQQPSSVLDHEVREGLFKQLLGTMGSRCFIEPPFRCDYGYNIKLGDDVYMNFDCVILDICPVEIGDKTLFGPGVHVYAATHPIDPPLRATGIEGGKPVKIGKNVWVGGRVVILPGVTIGDNTTIGAGSVVTKDVPANVVAAGNPCRVLRELK
ncbi:Maltose O-acetyltransferase [Diplonema papillatum]|nr:Maltose O-acetyltransferase [Diplonema papillatum]|eukprot:gene9620-14934_t